MLRIAGVFAFAVFVAASADAQELAGTFEQLRVLVKTGDALTVTDGAGQPVRGKLAHLSASSLVLNVSGTNREFQSAEVNTIEKRGSDSLRNGALIGMAVGAGLAALAMAATGSRTQAQPRATSWPALSSMAALAQASVSASTLWSKVVA